jgi:uroporphyrinogen-III synthase
MGGEPAAVPAVREVARLEQVPAFLDVLQSGRFHVAIFLTGVGASQLLREAQRLGRLDDAVSALSALITACRGPKPSAVLRQYGIPVTLRATEPYTTTELLEALSSVPLQGRVVALLHYGERNEPLADALRRRGAVLEELCLYEWRLPLDTAPLAGLVHDIVAGRIDAMAFTSQIQCRHLFTVAAEGHLADELADALRTRVTVAAIGPVCVETLKRYGVTPQLVPTQAKMGLLVTELGAYFKNIRNRSL